MSDHSYGFEGYNKEHMARAVGRDLPISTKQSIEICGFLRQKKLEWAKNKLKSVIEKKEAIPFKRFTNGLGHRKGKIASGRYPVKASQNVLDLLNTVEANASNKGLDTKNLIIKHIAAQMGSRPFHYGRQTRRQMKRTHVEIVVEEEALKKEEKKEKKQ